MAPENIYIIGTSSAGKTSLTKLFPNSYKKIRIDDYYDKYFDKCYKDVLKDVKNKFYDSDSINAKAWKAFDEIMTRDIKKMGKTVIDDVQTHLLNVVPKKNRIGILLYAPLKDIIRNINLRKATETRDLRAFEQFPGLYTATCDPTQSIDSVNRQQFIKDLADIKWLFNSQQHLESWAIGLFQKIGIVTDETHMLRVKNNVFDYIVNTNGKSSQDIYQEIFGIISRNNPHRREVVRPSHPGRLGQPGHMKNKKKSKSPRIYFKKSS